MVPKEVPMDFNPDDNTVATVMAYIQDHPEEADEVIAAEKAGKNRAGIVGVPAPTGVIFDRVGPETGALQIVSTES
jgi:hypothetical protein